MFVLFGSCSDFFPMSVNQHTFYAFSSLRVIFFVPLQHSTEVLARKVSEQVEEIKRIQIEKTKINAYLFADDTTITEKTLKTLS